MKPVVLVVDDDTAICALLQDVLSEHVFTVSVCHTGQEAILRIEGDPDIALLCQRITHGALAQNCGKKR